MKASFGLHILVLVSGRSLRGSISDLLLTAICLRLSRERRPMDDMAVLLYST